MFQLKSRVSSITLNDSERDVINERIVAYQEKTGIVYSSVKELFSALLSDVLSSESNPTPIPDHEPIPEITENTEEITVNVDDTKSEYDQQIQELSSEIVSLKDENATLKAEIEEIQNNQEVEVIEVEKPFEPNPTDVYLQLPTEKANLLQTIAENRLRKGKDKELLTVSGVAERLIFNRGTLYNWGGEMYTGL
jgi:hypothetical protein